MGVLLATTWPVVSARCAGTVNAPHAYTVQWRICEWSLAHPGVIMPAVHTGSPADIWPMLGAFLILLFVIFAIGRWMDRKDRRAD